MLTARRHGTLTSGGAVQAVFRIIPSLYRVALIAVLGAIFLVALAPRLDTDFWWHLKDGMFIASRHVVPSHDFMSYTFVGHGWTDHEWLAEVLLYGLYRAGGLWGPIAFFALVITATFALVYARMVQLRLNQVLALFIVSAAFIASSASWGPRIQMMTLLFLAAYLLALERFQALRSPRIFIVFPLIMLVWTNIHGGFVLGLAVLAITLAGEGLNALSHRDGAWSPRELKLLAISLLATFATTMVNPNGVRQLLYPLTFVLPNPFTNLIQESASPNFHMPVMMVFELMLLALIAAALLSRAAVDWTHLLLTVGFTHLAFSQVRNVAVWAVVVSPLVAAYLQAAVPEVRKAFPRLTYRRRPVESHTASLLNGVLLMLVVVAYGLEGGHFINGQALRQVERDGFPTGAVSYLERHSLPRHVFVSYSWGGYLLWHLSPAYQDFMDSRADTLYTARILRAYVEAYDARPRWSRVLHDYAVGTVLVERTAPLAQVLALDGRWRLAYRDGVAVIYRRA